MKLDILVIAAHPDDAELSCSGTIALQISKGNKVGVLDLTRGELGTRGTPEIRETEASAASEILGLAMRGNAMLPDGFFQNDENNQLKIASYIRKYQPEIVIANAANDRHPDHGRAAQLVKDSCFISGLARVKTVFEGKDQKPWRPGVLYHYIQSNYIVPDFIVDISDFWGIKIASIRAHKSQFFDPASKEPETYISSPRFLEFIQARCQQWGHAIGTAYGEGFTVERHIGVKNLWDLV